MKRKIIVDFVINLALLIVAGCVILLPTFKLSNIKAIMIIVFSLYSLFKLTQFVLTMKEKDYESLFAFIISLGVIISLLFIELTPKCLALIVFAWIGLMSLNKLKKADFYHDRKNKMWILRLIILFIFLTIGLLTILNLFYETSVQIIIIGYLLFINSVLDIIDPVVVYLMGDK
ncbi:MAG: hypothetical protein E7163_01670 [Firmicutes bacterium]|nr:hypothetical protein [Bacillota bacterium]